MEAEGGALGPPAKRAGVDAGGAALAAAVAAVGEDDGLPVVPADAADDLVLHGGGAVDERAADVLAGGAQGGVEVVEVVERRAREVARPGA